MPDISMCAGKRLADNALLGICIACHRRTATADELRQSYIAPPAEKDERHVWSCRMQWPEQDAA